MEPGRALLAGLDTAIGTPISAAAEGIYTAGGGSAVVNPSVCRASVASVNWAFGGVCRTRPCRPSVLEDAATGPMKDASFWCLQRSARPAAYPLSARLTERRSTTGRRAGARPQLGGRTDPQTRGRGPGDHRLGGAMRCSSWPAPRASRSWDWQGRDAHRQRPDAQANADCRSRAGRSGSVAWPGAGGDRG